MLSQCGVSISFSEARRKSKKEPWLRSRVAAIPQAMLVTGSSYEIDLNSRSQRLFRHTVMRQRLSLISWQQLAMAEGSLIHAKNGGSGLSRGILLYLANAVLCKVSITLSVSIFLTL